VYTNACVTTNLGIEVLAVEEQLPQDEVLVDLEVVLVKGDTFNGLAGVFQPCDVFALEGSVSELAAQALGTTGLVFENVRAEQQCSPIYDWADHGVRIDASCVVERDLLGAVPTLVLAILDRELFPQDGLRRVVYDGEVMDGERRNLLQDWEGRRGLGVSMEGSQENHVCIRVVGGQVYIRVRIKNKAERVLSLKRK
jgi:hypothetical protein